MLIDWLIKHVVLFDKKILKRKAATFNGSNVAAKETIKII